MGRVSPPAIVQREDRSAKRTIGRALELVSPSDMGRVAPPAFVQREDRSAGRTMVKTAVDLVDVPDQDINNSGSDVKLEEEETMNAGILHLDCPRVSTFARDIPIDDRSEDEVIMGESVDWTETAKAEADVPRHTF